MAFYPDELSPIEKLRGTGKCSELTDLNLMSVNRRQWKSIVLGKKDFGLNSFATIAEEKEEDMTSDSSNNTDPSLKAESSMVNIPNKKITFPKPRKYITSRVADRKDEMAMKTPDSPSKLSPKDPTADKKAAIGDDLSKVTNSSKMNLPEVKQLLKGKKTPGGDEIPGEPKQDAVAAYAVNETSLEKQWKDITANPPPMLTGWPKQDEDKPKEKSEKKKAAQRKAAVKKQVHKKSSQDNETKPTKKQGGEDSKDKALNMKDMVNVYKNLTYGTKDEIKSFVEKLSLVKDEEKIENDRNLISMMNLKVLETKIKGLEKKTGSTSNQIKKRTKPGKKARKAYTDNLARHKVVKVPATLDYKYSPENSSLSYGKGGPCEQKRKPSEDKVPWKYVGTQSVLDKSYLVYPSYPQPERKKSIKKAETSKKGKKEGAEEAPAKAKKPETKVTQSKDILIKGFGRGGSHSVNSFTFPGSRTAVRPSAAQVCNVEFRPEPERKSLSAGSPDHSLLVYLHGTKATHVRSPYSDKQFSRVTFFSKNGTRAPLIRGLPVGDGNRDATLKSVRFPDALTSDRVDDLLNFDEDVQKINEFLHSQSQIGGPTAGKRDRECRQRASSNGRASRRRAGGDDLLTGAIVSEISRDIEGLQYLQDTKENRQIIGDFFDELHQKIDRSRSLHVESKRNNTNNNTNKNNTNTANTSTTTTITTTNNSNNNNINMTNNRNNNASNNNNNSLIPILGY